MRSLSEVRPFLPIDLPLVRRLTPFGVSFDSMTSLTRGVHSLGDAVWSAVPLADLGTPTFVLRQDDRAYVGQFRHRSGEQHAHVTFIAPELDFQGEMAWLQLLDTMTQYAGRRGATTLKAEVAESESAFLTLRQAGFSVYARQEIWKRVAGPVPTSTVDMLRPETDEDAWAINGLYVSVVPRMVMQADMPPETGNGLIYERKGRMLGYFSVQEGKCGIYVQSILHPDAYDEVYSILASLLSHIPHAERIPVYMPVRRYQEWLQGTLDYAGFAPWTTQAVMVKHTVARIEHPAFKPIPAIEGVKIKPIPMIDCLNCNSYPAVNNDPAKERVNGISHNRRSGKAQSSSSRVSGGLA
jgi:hypothetical protein